MLEKRLAMAVDVIPMPFVAGQNNWVTVLADEGEHVYVQEVSDSGGSLFIDDDSSFFEGSRTEIAGFSDSYDELAVRSGGLVTVGSTVYPLERAIGRVNEIRNTADSPGWLTYISFTIPLNPDPYDDGNRWSELNGRIANYTPNQNWGTIDFYVVPGSFEAPGVTFEVNYDIDDNPQYADDGVTPLILTGEYVRQGENFLLTLTTRDDENINLFGGLASTDVKLESLVVNDNRDSDNYTLQGQSVGVRAGDDTPYSPPGTTEFQFLNIAPGGGGAYVPGTLAGELFIDLEGGFTTTFQVESNDRGVVPISFTDARLPEIVWDYSDIIDDTNGEYILRGEFDGDTGIVRIFTILDDIRERPIPLPLTIESASYGRRDFQDKIPTQFTLWDGHVFETGLTVDMVNPESRITIDSPVVTEGFAGSLGQVSLAATEIFVNSPVRASRTIAVKSGTTTDGYVADGNDSDLEPDDIGTISERVAFNARVSASQFDIAVANDPRTFNWTRGQLLITQTASLSNATDVLSDTTSALVNAGGIFVEADDADIYVEGRTAAVEHSYFMRSAAGSESDIPHRFLTASRLTGAPTGRIQGGTVAITLANDGFGEGFRSDGYSLVTLETDVDRLRVQAASRQDHALERPFAYQLSVSEINDLIVDGMAASSRSIEIDAAGDLNLISAIETERDLFLRSGNAFVLSAPVTTAFGLIDIEAPRVTLESAVRVLDGIQDETFPDISIRATNGPLLVADAVAALNLVKLESRGPGSAIAGAARVRGDIIRLASDGDVNVRTEGNLILARTTGRIRLDELDSAAFEVRDSPHVTLLSGGRDKFLTPEDPLEPKLMSPAIYADIYDTQTFVVSAPAGSVDVVHFGEVPLVIGDNASIQSGTEEKMVAAGSVKITSNLARSITVLDAPTANGQAFPVRVVTTERLPKSKYHSTNAYWPAEKPGVTLSRITTTVTPVLSQDGLSKVLKEFDGIGPTDLRVGDSVLVKDGCVEDPGNYSNGVYVVASLEYHTNGDVTVTLYRREAFDETAELSEPFYVRVTDGGEASENVGKVFVTEALDVTGLDIRETPLTVREVSIRPGYATVSAVCTAIDLGATFYRDPANPFNDYIEANVNGDIRSDRLLFDGVELFDQVDYDGERYPAYRVLVRLPIQKYAGGNPVVGEFESDALGVFEVTNMGSANTKWRLKRWEGDVEPGQTNTNKFHEGVVAVNAGSLRTSKTGLMYSLDRQAIDKVGLEFKAANSVLEIGSNNPYNTLSFIVSTENGTNDATGSFGRMLTLAQSNSFQAVRTQISQVSSIAFAGNVRDIKLEQALPAITEKLEISPSQGVAIDGSEVSLTRNGRIVRQGALSRVYAPIPPSKVKTERRLVRGVGVASPDVVHGLEILKNGAEGFDGSGTVVRNLRIGGFGSGAGIYIVGADNVLVESVQLGVGADGLRMPNQYGIDVVAGGEYTTILNSLIVSSADSGISLGTGSHGVRLVGNRVGELVRSNKVGVRVNSEHKEEHFIGAAKIPAGSVLADAESVKRLSFQIDLKLDAIEPALTNGNSLGDLYLGQVVTSTVPNVFGSNTRITRIEEVVVPGGVVVRLTLSSSVLSSQSSDIPLTFSDPPRNIIAGNQDGIVIDSGAVRVVNTDVTNSVFTGIHIVSNKVSNGSDLSLDGKVTIGGVEEPALSPGLGSEYNVGIVSNGLAGIAMSDGFWKEDPRVKPSPPTTPKGKFDVIMKMISVAGNWIGTDRNGREGFANGVLGDKDFIFATQAADGSLNEDVPLTKRFLTKAGESSDPERDPNTGKYTAPYRPEDVGASHPVGFDINNNFYGGSLSGGGDGTPPPLDPDPPGAW